MSNQRLASRCTFEDPTDCYYSYIDVGQIVLSKTDGKVGVTSVIVSFAQIEQALPQKINW
jgi:hypothetical protein